MTKTGKTKNITGNGGNTLLLALLVLLFTLSPALIKTVQACGGCGCVLQNHAVTQQLIRTQHRLTKTHITNEFKKHQIWLLDTFFKEYMLPAMMMMTEQLTTVGMQQALTIGQFLDAKHQLETERILQQLTAEAHKDYQPTLEMCTIGTAARGLASSDRNAELTAFVLSQRSQDRQLGHINSNASEGIKEDREGRLAQFKERYCDIQDNNGGFTGTCLASAPAETLNKDIDYTRTIGNIMTLDADFSDDNLSSDEQDLMALANNLFAHDVFSRPTAPVLAIKANQDDYMDVRAVVAKRSIAENSFHAIAAMKTSGTEIAGDTGQFVSAVLQQLGASPDDALIMLGERPSYYALMEILSQKIYQQPEFFTNLYDKPANVARKDVAMQAIDLMLDRDSYKSELRYEAMLAVLLELEVIDEQAATQNRLNWLTENGKED